MNPTIKTKQYIVCPKCGQDDWLVQHLLDDPTFRDRTFGPWACENPDCDVEIHGTVTADGQVEIEVGQRGYQPGFTLLQFRDLYLVVREMILNDHRADWWDYFYHSHQCPVNVLHRVVDVYNHVGSDPHSEIRYVATIPDTPQTRKQIEDGGSLRELFALFQTDGQPLPSEWPSEDGGLLPVLAEIKRQHTKSKSPKA